MGRTSCPSLFSLLIGGRKECFQPFSLSTRPKCWVFGPTSMSPQPSGLCDWPVKFGFIKSKSSLGSYNIANFLSRVELIFSSEIFLVANISWDNSHNKSGLT